MNRISERKKIDYVTLAMGLFVFFLPIEKQYSVIMILAMIVAFLFSVRFKSAFSVVRSNRAFRISVLFYILHLLGMLYSSNHQYGVEDLQTKLAFVFFPLLLSGFLPTESKSRNIRLAFIAGCTVSFLLFFTLSLKTFFETQDSQVLFYKGMSHWFHPTYLSLYYNIAILFVIREIFEGGKRTKSFFLGAVFLVLIVAILLLSSRTATFVAYLSVLLFPVMHYGREILRRINLSFYLVSILLMTGLFFGVLEFNNRYKQVEAAIENYKPIDSRINESTKQEEDNSSNARFRIWSYSTELIKKNIIAGVGTGDVKDELEKIFIEKNYAFGAEKHLNAHNQLLNTGVAFGFIGISVLLLLFIIPAFKAYQEKDWLALLFLMVFFLNCLTESILERQVGILCFCFFYSLFGFSLYKSKLG